MKNCLLCLLIVTVLGCGNNPKLGTVEIVSLSPDTAVALRPGQDVTISADIRYTLDVEDGGIFLTIQSGDVGGYSLAETTQMAFKGQDTITLEKTITVPDDADSIVVLVNLMVQKDGKTTISTRKKYKVKKN